MKRTLLLGLGFVAATAFGKCVVTENYSTVTLTCPKETNIVRQHTGLTKCQRIADVAHAVMSARQYESTLPKTFELITNPAQNGIIIRAYQEPQAEGLRARADAANKFARKELQRCEQGN